MCVTYDLHVIVKSRVCESHVVHILTCDPHVIHVYVLNTFVNSCQGLRQGNEPQVFLSTSL